MKIHVLLNLLYVLILFQSTLFQFMFFQYRLKTMDVIAIISNTVSQILCQSNASLGVFNTVSQLILGVYNAVSQLSC